MDKTDIREIDRGYDISLFNIIFKFNLSFIYTDSENTFMSELYFYRKFLKIQNFSHIQVLKINLF